MSRLYVATAGTSLLGNLAKAASGETDWLSLNTAQTLLRALPNSDRRDAQEAANIADGTGLFERLAASESLKELLRGDLPEFSARGASAETASLFADGAPHPSAEDHIVLATSDNAAGLESATALAYLLGGRVRIGTASSRETIESSLTDAGSGIHDQFGPDITVLCIRDLNTNRPDDFLSACSSLGRLMSWAYRTAAEGELVLHLTGGYKVTIPLILAIASHLSTKGPSVQAWANHDRSPRGIRLPLLRIGIEAALMIDLDAASHRDQPPNGHWTDYAYELGSDGSWQLTPLGQALHMMIA